jgi:hypothetical protein
MTQSHFKALKMRYCVILPFLKERNPNDKELPNCEGKITFFQDIPTFFH